MLAIVEILGIPVSFILLAIWLWNRHLSRKDKTPVHQKDKTPVCQKNETPVYHLVSWQNVITSKFGVDALKEVLAEILCDEFGYEFAVNRSDSQEFRRGDFSIKRLPSDRDVAWDQVPITLRLYYEASDDEETRVTVSFRTAKKIEFKEDAASFFHKHAEEEFDGIIECINEYVSQNWPDEDENEDEEDQEDEYSPGHTSSLDGREDYEELGLKPGVSWPDVQAAYRQLCLKYHPDTLASQNLPPHLVELAVDKFKGITDSYQRLKSRLS